MRGTKIPSLVRNALDGSITLSYQQPKYTLIWLHGAGDQPDSYVPYFTHLLSPLYLGCRIRLLAAPNKLLSPTLTPSPGWFDNETDLSNVNNSKSYVQKCFNEQMTLWKQAKQGSIPSQHRIYVGGMGQGASIALDYTYSADEAPAGVIALSGSLLPSTKLNNFRKMPALIMHGRKDETKPEISARRSYNQLLKDQFLVQYKVYDDLEHGVNLQQLTKISEWMEESHEFIRKHYETAI